MDETTKLIKTLLFFLTYHLCNGAFTFVFRQIYRGVARIFQRGGHTVSNIIVMAFSPRNIVGCLLKKRLTKGGSRAPQDPPRYALDLFSLQHTF